MNDALRIIVLVLGGYFLLFLVINAWYDDAARNLPPLPRRRRKARSLDFATPPPFSPLPKVPPDVLSIVRDAQTAYRLFDEVQSRYPNQSEQWLWEKVQWDVIRDRR